MVNYELRIYNKLNQNVALADFNPASLNFILANVGASSETPQESSDNRDS